MPEFSRDPARFRNPIRQWFNRNNPVGRQGRGAHKVLSESVIFWGGKRCGFSSPTQKDCICAAASKGPTVPTWSIEYGGVRLPRVLQQIWRDELARDALGCTGINCLPIDAGTAGVTTRLFRLMSGNPPFNWAFQTGARHLKRRKQVGVLIGTFQALQHRHDPRSMAALV